MDPKQRLITYIHAPQQSDGWFEAATDYLHTQVNRGRITTPQMIRDILHSNFVIIDGKKPTWESAAALFYARQFERPAVVWIGRKEASPALEHHADEIVFSAWEALNIVNYWAAQYDAHAVVWKKWHGTSYATIPLIREAGEC